jgi:8-oxo-dGTP pyrophosphatase MutT (NUDIX family)
MDARAASPFSAEDFRMRLAHGDVPHAEAGYGDHTLNPGMHDMIVHDSLRDAAVLIPVVDRGDEEATVLLTQRAEKLRSHSGQVAFPGGRIDATDASAEDAALRETFEEIGLTADRIDVIGRMPDYVTGSGYRIVPVLGIVQPGFALAINGEEVDAAFEVPLGFLMNAANHNRESRFWLEREHFYYTMPYGDRFIWGVTAGIIRTLYERLYA